MTRYGYALSSEEHRPADLVRNAAAAEEAGFEFALISDHYHPWIDAQGQSPFVWTVLGAIARETSNLDVGTGVTCPTIRIHPAVIAQAAATTADLFEGRFFLGVGTGENLNEHILGDPWPTYDERAEMLVEAIQVMRGLWEGHLFSHRGDHYIVENARIYTLPKEAPRILVAASGQASASLAAEHAEGLIVTSPDAKVLDSYRQPSRKPGAIYGQVTVCWAPSVEEAQKTAHRIWPNAGIPGELSQELALPRHFEQASSLVTPESMAEHIPMGPDPNAYVAAIGEYIEAGVENVYVHQIGPDQAGFLRFFGEELRPALERVGSREPAAFG